MEKGSGLSVIVTRSEAGDGPLTSLLEARGATVVHWPTVRYEMPEDPDPLYDALQKMESYDWIVFTSPRSVTAVIKLRPSPPGRIQVAAVGSATSAALEQAGWPIHLVPDGGTGAALIESFERMGGPKGRVFFPASSIARPTVRQGLEHLGYLIDQVEAYQTVEAELDRNTCLTEFQDACPDVISFASPSAVESLHRILGTDDFNRILACTPAVAIGPVTAEALEQIGRRAAAIAYPHTLDGLADTVIDAVGRLKN